MEAIALIPGTKKIRLVDRPEPVITADDEIKIRIIRVGICGTDREEISGGRAMAPEGYKDLVIGHEMFGQVIATGKNTTRVKSGDFAVLTVRRGCGKCLPCHMNRSDMCETGEYKERGIWGLDGYQAEFVVDHELYAVKVPEEIEPTGVLIEPLSISEKAIHEALGLQFARVPGAMATPLWLNGRRCLVAGLGPVGLLAAMALVLRGAEVYGLDIVDANSVRPRWLTAIGGRYIDGRQVPAARLGSEVGSFDLILEAAGAPDLDFNLLEALNRSGIYMVTGIPGRESPIKIPGAALIKQLVLSNQLMAGSVNASLDHFQMAVNDLLTANLSWPGHVEKLITHRYPFKVFLTAFAGHPVNEIKTTTEWWGGME